jgi:Ni/Co efflux regulator RcnB
MPFTDHTMKNSLKHSSRAFAVALALGLSLAPALAEKPDHAGGGKHGKGDKYEHSGKADKGGKKDRDDKPRYSQGSGDRSSSNVAVQINIGSYFQDSQRVAVRDYYEPQFRAGNCPPGLAKKNNGCMPPGQAKKWRKGYRLPSDVVYYPVPNDISIRLGVPPSGYKYVRVAADILLIAVGTSMVVDAIEDLSRL